MDVPKRDMTIVANSHSYVSDEHSPVRVQDAREELLLAEVDLAKAQAEGPASHRKRDYIDKATKEVGSAAFC